MTSSLKVMGDSIFLMSEGREFQSLGAEMRKAREPNERLCLSELI